MSLSDPIGDMLARLKNSQLRNHKKIELPSSKFKTKIAEILKSEGYIIDYEVVNSENNKANLLISLKYSSGNPVISSIERIQLATLGSAVNSGDLSAAKQSGATSASSTRMVFAGAYAPSPTRSNVIEYKQFATDGDVIDFGDLLATTVNITGVSNGHGGLGN